MRFVGLFSFLIFGGFASGQLYNPGINQKLSDSEDAIDLVQTFQSFGTKTPNSQQSIETLNWLVGEYQDMGYSDIVIDSFTRNGATYRNLIVTKQGSHSQYLVVCGHYDTRTGPGANDNGSGVSAILLAANAIKDESTTRTVQFIHFDGEELGFEGSLYHVDNLKKPIDSNLYCVLNIDQIGGTIGEPGNDKIYCERDEDNNISSNDALSWTITDTLANLCELYTDLSPVISKAFSSDYIPFERDGYVITGLYQHARDVYGHSLSDSLSNMDSFAFVNGVRLSVAATVYFAQVNRFVGLLPVSSCSIKIYPNPVESNLIVEGVENNMVFEITDMSGRVVKHGFVANHVVDCSDLNLGTYFFVTESGTYRFVKQ